MGDYRSKSFTDGYQMESYNYGDLRSPPPLALALPPTPPPQLKKGKSRNGPITKRSWSMNDPEFQRKKRVASYKVYSVEGKVKGSFKRSFRWLRDKYSQVVYGWW